MNVNLFTFWWNNVSNANANPNDWFADNSLREPHLIFNEAFVASFPKLQFTAPFTNYTDRSIAANSRLTGTAETAYGIEAVKAWILEAAKIAGIKGNTWDLNISLKTINQIQQGDFLTLPDNSNINDIFTQDGSDKAKQQIGLYLGMAAAVLIFLRLRG